MSQILILPINDAIISAGFKSEGYKARYKTQHYGVDMYSNASTVVYACGKGKVVCAGYDNVVGNTVCVVYEDVWDGEKAVRLAVRCFHLSDVAVKVGQSVNKDTVLGHFGATGMYVDGAHLHIEVDSDPDHWQGVPSLSPSPSTLYYAGGDTMRNPAEILHPFVGDYQRVTFSESAYQGKKYAPKGGFSETAMLEYDPAGEYRAQYEKEKQAHDATKKELQAAKTALQSVEKKIEKALSALK